MHPNSVEYLFQEAHRRNMCVIAGNVLMDRNAPDTVLSKADKSYLSSKEIISCLLYTSPSPRDATLSRMPSSA